ncbi:hypothetical protein C6946_22115, partial [Burkholderia thailandensis]
HTPLEAAVETTLDALGCLHGRAPRRQCADRAAAAMPGRLRRPSRRCGAPRPRAARHRSRARLRETCAIGTPALRRHAPRHRAPRLPLIRAAADTPY